MKKSLAMFLSLALTVTCTVNAFGFTPDHDIVHLINICIRTLQGHPKPNQPLSERNALRLLIHFIGDLHQPLHVGVGFIDANGPNNTILLVTDPNTIRQRGLPNDRGANQLITTKRLTEKMCAGSLRRPAFDWRNFSMPFMRSN